MPEVLRRRPRTASLSGVDIAKMRADTFEAEVGEGDDLVTAAGVVVAVLPGIATAGLDSQHPEVGVLPGDGDLDTKDGEGAVSADIHIETDCFLAEDAGVGGNHPEAGGFTGVEREHVHSGKPHTHTKPKWGGIGKNSFFFFFQISETYTTIIMKCKFAPHSLPCLFPRFSGPPKLGFIKDITLY